MSYYGQKQVEEFEARPEEATKRSHLEGSPECYGSIRIAGNGSWVCARCMAQFPDPEES